MTSSVLFFSSVTYRLPVSWPMEMLFLALIFYLGVPEASVKDDRHGC